MLHLTPAAAQYIDELRREQGLPDSVGIRVSSGQASAGELSNSAAAATIDLRNVCFLILDLPWE